jgi:ribosomal protein S17
MVIEKKVWKKFFQDIIDGKKNFEIRLDNFECNEGDTLLLKEWDEVKKEFTGRQLEKTVTYLIKTKNLAFWKTDEIEKYGYQIIGFK